MVQKSLKSEYAARMLCPFKISHKRPLKAVVYLCVGLLVLLLDCVFSNRILRLFTSHELMFVACLAICGFSVLVDIWAIKRSFSRARADILPRFTAIFTAMLFAAAAIIAMPLFDHSALYTTPILLICTVPRLFTTSVRKALVPVTVGLAVLAAVVISSKIITGTWDLNQAMLQKAFPLCMSAAIKIKDFVISRW